MRPSLRQLEYLVAVAESLNFREAGEACHVSQPALSVQIQQLEKLLGVQLFERDRRRVLVTEAGRQLVERARAALAQVDDLVDTARIHKNPLSGTIRMGVIPTVAPYLLPRVLPSIRRRYPRLRILLHEDQTDRLVDLLKHGKLDVLLLALEVELADVEVLPLFADPFVVAASPTHWLAGRKTVTEQDLLDERVLLLEDGHCLRDQVLALCDRAGAREFDEFRATSMSTLVQMVAGGAEGVTLLPAMAVDVEVRSKRQMIVRRFAKPEPHRTIGIAWRRTSPRREEFLLLGKEIENRGPTESRRS